jgi:4-carboxymuconolactone decarboxylase
MTSVKLPDRSGLKASWRILILISANLARRRYRVVAELIRDAGRNRVPTRRIYEIILQSYLFLGYPKAIEGLRLLNKQFPEFVPPPAENIDSLSVKLWRERGEALCRTIYDSNYGSLRERMKALSPDLDNWMVWEGYGKVLSRAGVPPVVRELCTCSALVVTGDIVQLHSHMRGAINAGASGRMLRETIELLEGTAKRGRYRQASRLLDHILLEADGHA